VAVADRPSDGSAASWRTSTGARLLHMTFEVRRATRADLPEILPRTRALNAHEGIAIADAELSRALGTLLDDPALGVVFLVADAAGSPVGHAIVTYGYDLEFAGRDAFLTELWIDEPARRRGAGTAALAQLEPHVREAGVRALHLQVRPDNPALRLYERTGFAPVPRVTMTKRL
jgi:ribosomal protein S18 acetylase RimI-like enzyme